jgi:acyl-coenzyme A thioesterase PaaI-like protein
MPKSPLPTPQQATDFVRSAIPLASHIGLQVRELTRNRVVLDFPFEGNTNHVGIMYAGVLFSAAEIPPGILALVRFDPARFYPVIKEMTVSYRRPGRTGVRVVAELPEARAEQIQAEAEAMGKSEFVMELEVRDESDEVVMTSRGVYQLRAFPASA